jgi:hypothetical protein
LVDFNFPESPYLSIARNLVLDPQLIGHHRDEFSVDWLRLAYVDRIAEQMADRVVVAARPSDF